MIKTQLLFALRRLGLHKLTTGINILGLTFGILSCVVIYLYVAFEFSYDKFHADADRIYRVVISMTQGNGAKHDDAGMSAALGPALRHETTGFSAVTTLFTDDSRVLIPMAGQSSRHFLRNQWRPNASHQLCRFGLPGNIPLPVAGGQSCDGPSETILCGAHRIGGEALFPAWNSRRLDGPFRRLRRFADGFRHGDRQRLGPEYGLWFQRPHLL